MKRALSISAVGLALFASACGSSSTSKAADKPTTTTAPAKSTTTAHDMDAMGHDDDHGEKAADKGLGMLSNGHHEEMKYVKLDAATQAELDAQLELSRKAVAAVPTLGAMHAAGGRNAGPFSPGLGLHVTAPWVTKGFNADGVVDGEDASHPLIVIYDGTSDDAKVAGFMYYSYLPIDGPKPEGFPGKNDTWHYHTNVCTKFTPNGTEAPFGADRPTTKAMCDKVGGVLMKTTQWMVHVWSIPGYEVAEKDGGVFAEVNPKLDCSDGTYFMMEEKDWIDHPLDICKSEL